MCIFCLEFFCTFREKGRGTLTSVIICRPVVVDNGARKSVYFRTACEHFARRMLLAMYWIDIPRSLGSSFGETNSAVFPVVSDAVRLQENSTQGPRGVWVFHVLSGLAVEFVSRLCGSKSQRTLPCKSVLNRYAKSGVCSVQDTGNAAVLGQ